MTNFDIAALATEMGAGDFLDPRLGRRLELLVSKLAVCPEVSFPKALSSAELEAAYRFFSNPKVTPEAILGAHIDGTRSRAVAEGTALVIHDTTALSYRAEGKREGLGRLNKSGQTFFAHAALCVAADGTRRPLGVAGIMTWARGEEKVDGERARWFDLVDIAARGLAGASLIHVMDREADDYTLFAHLIQGNHRFVIRSMHDRLLAECSDPSMRKLNDALARIERSVERDATLSKRVDGSRSPVQKRIHPSRATRVATLAIGASRVLLKRPTTVDASLPESLQLHVVRVWEPNPPSDQPPVEWTLLTTEPINTNADLERIVDWYRARWTIEEYFKALKTGCSMEARQLGDYESLVNALATFAPIACRLLALRSAASQTPEAPAATLLPVEQIEVLRVLGRRPLPHNPTALDTLLAIAALGGHLKHSGPPGWLTIARGYSELLTLTRGWLAAQLQRGCDQG